MFYKKFSGFCFAALLAMQAAVCSATVPQDANNDAKPKVLNQRVLKQAEKKAQKQAKQAAKKAKKQKNSQIAVGEAAVVSTKPSVVRDVPQSVKTEGVIKTPAAKPLLTERNGKYYFLGTELPEAYRSISIYGEPSATKTQAVAYIK